MPLCIRNGYRELQDQLEELRQQGYFYIGEYVFAGSHNEQTESIWMRFTCGMFLIPMTWIGL